MILGSFESSVSASGIDLLEFEHTKLLTNFFSPEYLIQKYACR